METNGKQRLWSQKIRKIVHNNNTKKLDFSILFFYANSKRLLKLEKLVEIGLDGVRQASFKYNIYGDKEET
jgi:hypothetical protein